MIRKLATLSLSTAILTMIPLAAAASPHASLNRENWIAVADHLIQTPLEDYPYDWGEATLFIGLLKTYERTHNVAYIDYVARWAALYTSKSREELLGTRRDRLPSRRKWRRGGAHTGRLQSLGSRSRNAFAFPGAE